ncbi:DUF4145 domain-containing protein [Nonomuraea wenchangensis]
MTSAFQYEITCWACAEDQAAEEQSELVTGRTGDHDNQKIRLAIATCNYCSAPMVLHQELIWDDYREEETVRSTRANVVWPITDQRSMVRSILIPEELRREHQEAQRCFNADAYTATVVMVRRALEGVCSQHKITATSLVRALEEMESQGLIEGRLLEWAQELRVLGNQAAHFTGRPVARQDAQDALELLDALLDYLYLFTGRFNAFKERRSEAHKSASGGGAPAPG